MYTTREFFALLGQAIAAGGEGGGHPHDGRARRRSDLQRGHRRQRVRPRARGGATGVGATSCASTSSATCWRHRSLAVNSGKTGVIYLGGGTPKNFIQQSAAGDYIHGREASGHSYGIQITMDQPQWGGLSGCTFEEAQSWRKISPEADFVTVNVEVTVALPLIVSALAESHG